MTRSTSDPQRGLGVVAAPLRRSRRLFAAATAVTLAVGAGLVAPGTAHARPGDSVSGGGTPPVVSPGTPGGVTGTVDLDGCVTQGSNVRVTVSGAVATVTADGGGRYTYLAEPVAVGSHLVAATLLNGACRLGTWTKQSGSVAVRAAILEVGPTLQYRMATKMTRVPGFLIAGAARRDVGAIDVRLHNFGPARSGTRQLDNGSQVTIAGSQRVFTVPEHVIDLDACQICPDLGDAKFYVNDMRANGTSYAWNLGKGLSVGITFESAARELKGFYKGAGIFSDDLMPDIEIANGRLTVMLIPMIDGAGGVTLTPSLSTFTGSMTSTGACTVYRIDICQKVTGYRAKISAAIQGAARDAFGTPAVRAEIAAKIRPVLDAAGIGVVAGVVIDGDDVVIIEA